jgi:MOSC domain-containing protein YiiM
MGRLLSVNVGKPRLLARGSGQALLSAIVKAPVEGRVRVEGINIAGDKQADMSVHGGPDKAIYAYASEDFAWWEELLGTQLPQGIFGENLTTEHVDVSGAVIGERWRLGTVELEVCQPRLPCVKLGLRFGDLRMVKAFGKAARPGAYLRIGSEGEIGAGDEIEVLDRPDHGITIALVFNAKVNDHTLRPLARSAPQLAGDLLAHLQDRAA